MYTATVDNRALVVKLVPGRNTDESALRRRAELQSTLATRCPEVVAPETIDGRLVNRLGQWLAVGFPHVDGRPPDPISAPDVRLMGRTLARLHRQLALMSDVERRPVRALAIADVGSQPRFRALLTRPHQLLHGDYGPANLIIAGDGLRIIDFDDCGHGPVEFELGNTLFMMLFDTTVNRADCASDDAALCYRTFRRDLVRSYSSAAQRVIDDDLLDAGIELRRAVLRHWLDRPSEGPAGIRNADPAWRRVLEEFVRSGPPICRP